MYHSHFSIIPVINQTPMSRVNETVIHRARRLSTNKPRFIWLHVAGRPKREIESS